MITITPQGSVYLCKTPLEKDYKHQLTFASANAQQTYFASKVQYTCTDFTYMKKDNQIVVDYPIDQINSCNYLFYKNTGFTNKYYYCFITNMEYVNENATRITFETDVWQTYQLELTYKKSFVEREHVNDDTFGKHTVPENLETGEYVINSVTETDASTSYKIVIACSKLPKEIMETVMSGTIPTKTYNGVYSGLFYITFETFDDATKFLLTMDGQGIGECVYSVFQVPNLVISSSTLTYETGYCQAKLDYPLIELSFNVNFTIKYKIIDNSATANLLATQTITRNATLNGYTPKNNKMFTGEFNYMYIASNGGDDGKFNYEDFYNSTVEFKIFSALTTGGSVRLIPQNYMLHQQGVSEKQTCNPYGLTGCKYPTCSWTSDSYTNWLTQQGTNATGETLSALTTLGVGLATGNPLAIGMAGANALIDPIEDMITKKEHRRTMPPQAKGNINAGDLINGLGLDQFIIYQMSVRYEFAKICDDFLSAYGYRVNEQKTPNVTGRTYWNYVKTRECNIEADIPQEHLQQIKDMFNKGVTFWHDPTKFLDYSQSNTIVTP